MRRSRSAGVERSPAGTLEDSLARFVDLVCPQLPAGLLGPDRESHMRAAVRHVPAEVVARFGFECRIDIDAPDADMFFCAKAETGGLQMLAGRDPLVPLPRQLAESAAWAPVIRLCAQCEDRPALERATTEMCAELALRPGYETWPNVSFGLRLAGSPEAPRRPLEVLLRVLELGFEALAGGPRTAAHAAALRSLLRALPETARVAGAGTASGVVRLWLARMTREEIVDLVEMERERSEARAIDGVLDGLAAPNVRVDPRLEVGTAVEPRTRLICTVDSPGSPSAWEPLLDRLVEYELCTPHKRDALARSYGMLREHEADRWPEHLTRQSALFGKDAESVVSWRLGHVDVQCDGGEPVAATATIRASHGWCKQ